MHDLQRLVCCVVFRKLINFQKFSKFTLITVLTFIEKLEKKSQLDQIKNLTFSSPQKKNNIQQISYRPRDDDSKYFQLRKKRRNFIDTVKSNVHNSNPIGMKRILEKANKNAKA